MHNPADWTFWSSWSVYELHPINWMLRLFWNLIYNVLIFCWFLNGNHEMFLWIIMVVTLWRLDISVIAFTIIMILVVFFLIIFVLIFLNVYICGVILFFRVLIFDVIIILLTSLLIHSCNTRSLIQYWNICIVISNGVTFTTIKSE